MRSFASPTPDTVSAVTEWLNQNGIINITTTGAFDDWIAFTVTVSTANSLINADFQFFDEIGGPTQKLTRTLEYSLPVELQQHINLIHPTTDFVKKRVARPKFRGFESLQANNNTARALTAPAACNSVVSPTCIQVLPRCGILGRRNFLKSESGPIWDPYNSCNSSIEQARCIRLQ